MSKQSGIQHSAVSEISRLLSTANVIFFCYIARGILLFHIFFFFFFVKVYYKRFNAHNVLINKQFIYFIHYTPFMLIKKIFNGGNSKRASFHSFEALKCSKRRANLSPLDTRTCKLALHNLPDNLPRGLLHDGCGTRSPQQSCTLH